MIRIFRKSWRRLKRTVCGALCLIFLFSLFAVQAGAAGWDSGYINDRIYLNGTQNMLGMEFPSTGNTYGQSLSGGVAGANSIYMDYSYFSPGESLSGTVGLYYSFYFRFPQTSDLTYSLPSSLMLRVTTGSGEVYEDVSHYIRLSTYAIPQQDGFVMSPGFLVKGRSSFIETIAPVSLMQIFYNGGLKFSYTLSDLGSPLIYFPSVQLVVSDSGTLDSLEGIVDGIAAQSEIMSAFYGDIMALLNDLYARLGDMKAVEELTNTYFAQLIPLVNSINTNTANIYSLLQTQFQLLRTLIATESDDIKAAIQQQTDDLKAYFDYVFSGSVGDMPEMSDDLDSAVGDFSSAEQDYQSNATQRFDELAASFNGFTGGTLAGITLASTLFKRVWDALGEYNIVYTYPLLLGLSLLLIGRLSRLSGGQSSAEKHRGDSDA